MFRALSLQQRQAVFVMINVNIPAERCTGSADCEFGSGSRLWSGDFIDRLHSQLRLRKTGIGAYLPLVLYDVAFCELKLEVRQTLMQPYVDIITEAGITHIQLYAQILILLVHMRKFDGRGRVLMRNLAKSLALNEQDDLWIEFELAKFLIEQEEIKLAATKEGKKDKYRYVKIGAASLGAGALLAVTGGMAAPAVAAALIAMGYSAATAATIAGSMALLFGGTGAGLVGYKMTKRTRGLTEFHFKQYDEKGKMAVIVMISGWMDQDEDDKRVFGLVPQDMGLKERLHRFYQLHAPEKLCTVENESKCFEDDPEQICTYLKEAYDKDPREMDSLMPPLPQPPVDGTPYLDIIASYFEDLAAAMEDEEKRQQERGGPENEALLRKGGSFKFKVFGSEKTGGEGSTSRSVDIAATTYAPAGTAAPAGVDHLNTKPIQQCNDDDDDDDGKEEEEEEGANGFQTLLEKTNIQKQNYLLVDDSDSDMEDAMEDHSMSAAALEEQMEAVSPRKHCGLKADDESRTTASIATASASTPIAADSSSAESDESSHKEELRLRDVMQYWHWRELPISSVYELTLLHWESKLQKELGKSVLSLLEDLGMMAAEQALAYTLLSAVMTAVALPAALLSMTSAIDNLWLIACERADEAGRELAKALLLRLHGDRPVTLVGFSMGSRVIFSCLRTLAKQLEEEEEEEARTTANSTTSRQPTTTSSTHGSRTSADNVESVVEHTVGNVDSSMEEQQAQDSTLSTSKGNSNHNDYDDDDDDDDDDYNLERQYYHEVGLDTPAKDRVETTTPTESARPSLDGSATASSTTSSYVMSTFSNFYSSLRGTRKGKGGQEGRAGTGGEKAEAGAGAGESAHGKEDLPPRPDENSETTPPRLTAIELKSLIKDVVLLGSPLNLKSRQWAKIRSVVGGRLINGYSRKDMVLSIIYRYQRYKVQVSGIAPVKVAGVENVNLTHIVSKHIEYCSKMKEILQEVNLADVEAYTTSSSSVHT